MAFEPFGYRFDIRSSQSVADLKAAIRQRKKAWFDARHGARGWIVGPFICLWASAFDRYGPMLFGWIGRDGTGSRVRGRAGSDLNGLLMFVCLIPLLAFCLYKEISERSWQSADAGLIGLIVVLTPLMLWMGHSQRKDAEPLVRFLASTAIDQNSRGRKQLSSVRFKRRLRLTTDGDELRESATSQSVHQALLDVGVGDFLILAAEPERYMQTRAIRDGFILEKREGDERSHFQAYQLDPRGDGFSRQRVLTFDQVLAAFLAYGAEAPMPSAILWEAVELAD